MTTIRYHRRKKASGKPVWADLPYDCLVNILNHLTSKDRWQSTMFVCKSWHHATKVHPIFDLESYVLESRPSESVEWWKPDELISWWTPSFERKIDSIVCSVLDWSGGGLKEIRVRHCSDRSLLLIAERCPNLEVLSIKSSPNVTDESMVKISSKCSKLREVDISYCYGISHTSIEMLGRNCKNILILKCNHMINSEYPKYLKNVPVNYLRSRPKDGDLRAAAIAKFMPQLLHLELRFATLSAQGFMLISERCKKLEYLDLLGCRDIIYVNIRKSQSSLRILKSFEHETYNYIYPQASAREVISYFWS